MSINRRQFLQHTGAGALATWTLGCDVSQNDAERSPKAPTLPARVLQPYKGPNVILIRFGGGVRRLETIMSPEKTYCPFVYHELYKKQGILFDNVEIEGKKGVETSHGQGTLFILTGKYDKYEDITHKPFSDRFEAQVPTIFEYFRRAYDVPEYQTLIINGEDRINEEFYTFSNHHLYGVRYRSTVLSLYRFKTYLLREDLKVPNLSDEERQLKEHQLKEMEDVDYRVEDRNVTSPQLDRFWASWREYYGRTGLVNPRGDGLLTVLALQALKQLRPRLLMINYQDTDYVHWGNPSFYTRAISHIDDGIRQIYHAVQADEEYRDNTIFLVVPDCGRDNNRCMAVPFQHHFNSRSAHQIFVVAAGPGIVHATKPVDKPKQQISVAATIGRLMKFPTDHVEADCLEEMLS